MSTYTIVKLTTGQDIICSLAKDNLSSPILEIENPMSIYHRVEGDGVTMVLLKRYNPLALSSKMKIERSHIVATYAPQKSFVDYYEAVLAFHEKVIDELATNDIEVATSFIDSAIMNKKIEKTLKGIKEKENVMPAKNTSKKVH